MSQHSHPILFAPITGRMKTTLPDKKEIPTRGKQESRKPQIAMTTPGRRFIRSMNGVTSRETGVQAELNPEMTLRNLMEFPPGQAPQPLIPTIGKMDFSRDMDDESMVQTEIINQNLAILRLESDHPPIKLVEKCREPKVLKIVQKGGDL